MGGFSDWKGFFRAKRDGAAGSVRVFYATCTSLAGRTFFEGFRLPDRGDWEFEGAQKKPGAHRPGPTYEKNHVKQFF